MTGDDDTGKKQQQKKSNRSVSAITSSRKNNRKKRTTHSEGGKQDSESNIKSNNYKDSTSDNQRINKKCINKSIKLMNGDQMNYDLNHSSKQLTMEDTMNCQNIQQIQCNSISDTEIIEYNNSPKERYSYSHCRQPVSFTQSSRHCTPKSNHSTRLIEQKKSGNFEYLPKNENVNNEYHRNTQRLLNISTDHKNDDESLIESVKSWIHTQCQIKSQSDLNGCSYLASLPQLNNKNYLNQNKDNDCKNKNPNTKEQMLKLDVIIEEILTERHLFREMCAKNRFYTNPNFNKPWNMFNRISEKLINGIVCSIESDFVEGVSTFVNDFLDKEIKH